MKDYDLTPDEIYNADESGIYWKYWSTKTLAGADERKTTSYKLNKERLTVLRHQVATNINF